ncbi:MAG: hypothetical protein Q4G09_05695 [Clostridia bacterium]|nr:hypothetical protein [Clostridia bacterium]
MEENSSNQVSNVIENEVVKNIADVLKKSNDDTNENNIPESTFKVANTNLPEKTGVWTKVKNVLLYDIKVELTPYQQKVEDEINELLYKEITWKDFKNFLFQEVAVTYKGKKVF